LGNKDVCSVGVTTASNVRYRTLME